MIVLETIVLLIFWGWAISALLFLRNTLLPRTPLTETPGHLGLMSEAVRFSAVDGTRLEGWKIAGDPANPWVILSHGAGSNRADMLKVAAGLRSSGLNLFLYDFRGHGSSAGRVSSFGWTEQSDLQGALAFLSQQPEIRACPYGIYGASMGASVALMVAAQDERIGAIAVEGSYTDLHESLRRHLGLLYGLPAVPFVWFVALTYRLRFGVWPSRVSPLAAIRAVSPRPVLLIQGMMDTRTPPDATRRLFDAAREPKDLWILQGAGHLDGFSADPESYGRRLSEFFGRALGG